MSTILHPVHLVGAGLAGPELLTLKAVRVLRQATVVLVDDLVGHTVLEHALADLAQPPRQIRVGKRGGRASTSQAFIQRLMVREALAGERVVRLKAGDPLVFWRAGKQIAALGEAGLVVEVVHWIKSGLTTDAQLSNRSVRKSMPVPARPGRGPRRRRVAGRRNPVVDAGNKAFAPGGDRLSRARRRGECPLRQRRAE